MPQRSKIRTLLSHNRTRIHWCCKCPWVRVQPMSSRKIQNKWHISKYLASCVDERNRVFCVAVRQHKWVRFSLRHIRCYHPQNWRYFGYIQFERRLIGTRHIEGRENRGWVWSHIYQGLILCWGTADALIAPDNLNRQKKHWSMKIIFWYAICLMMQYLLELIDGGRCKMTIYWNDVVKTMNAWKNIQMYRFPLRGITANRISQREYATATKSARTEINKTMAIKVISMPNL